MKEEVWKPIKGYEGRYEVSSYGYIKSIHFKHRGKTPTIIVFKPHFYEKSTNVFVTLTKDKRQKTFNFPILLAEHFIPNPHNYRDVRYKDGNKRNYDLENLEWDVYDHISPEEFTNEEWKICKVIPTIEISTLGRLRETYTKKIFKTPLLNGYPLFTIKYKRYSVHRLMAYTFITDGKNFEEDVHHIDENKENNRLSNLQLLDHTKHGMLSFLSNSCKVGYKGKIGKFDKNGILLECFLGQKAVEEAGYIYTSVVGVCKGRTKSHKKFYWKRFPIGYEPIIGEKYDLNSDILNSEKVPPKYVKKSNRKEYETFIF